MSYHDTDSVVRGWQYFDKQLDLNQFIVVDSSPEQGVHIIYNNHIWKLDGSLFKSSYVENLKKKFPNFDLDLIPLIEDMENSKSFIDYFNQTHYPSLGECFCTRSCDCSNCTQPDFDPIFIFTTLTEDEAEILATTLKQIREEGCGLLVPYSAVSNPVFQEKLGDFSYQVQLTDEDTPGWFKELLEKELMVPHQSSRTDIKRHEVYAPQHCRKDFNTAYTGDTLSRIKEIIAHCSENYSQGKADYSEHLKKYERDWSWNSDDENELLDEFGVFAIDQERYW